MAEHNDHFAPETIDEQTEQFPMLLRSEDARLVNDLHASYRTYSQKNFQSLEKVWSHILQNKGATSSMPIPLKLAAMDARQERFKMYLDHTPDSLKRGKVRTAINTSVTVSIMAALVASIIIVFNFVHIAHTNSNISSQNKHSSAVLTSPTKQPVQPIFKDATGLYLLDAFSTSDFQVQKLDLKTHAVLWHYDIGGSSGSHIAVKGNTAYLTTYTDSGPLVLALDANIGTKRWATNLAAETQAAPRLTFAYLSDVTIDNGIVYIMAEDGQVFALNATNGKQRWKYASGDRFWISSGTRDKSINAVTVVNNVVYGGVHNILFAVDARNGHQIWSHQVASYLLLGQPQVSNGNLYLTSYEEPQGTGGQSQRGFIFAFQASNGVQRWQYQAGNWILSDPVVVGNAVYFGSYDTDVYALNISNGSVIWKDTTAGQVYDAPVFNNGILYVTQSGNATPAQQNTVPASMLALNATNGNLVWEKTTDASVAAINDGIIYADLIPRTMVGIDTKTGNTLWQGQYGADLINKLGGHSSPAPFVTVVS